MKGVCCVYLCVYFCVHGLKAYNMDVLQIVIVHTICFCLIVSAEALIVPFQDSSTTKIETYTNTSSLTLECLSAGDEQIIIQRENEILNSTDRSAVLTITFNPMLCENSGIYVCLKTNKRLQVEKEVFNVGVSRCQPRACGNDSLTNTLDMSPGETSTLTLCVLIPNPYVTTPLAVSYLDQWLTNQQCVSGKCFYWFPDRKSVFKYNINLTLSNITKEDYGNFTFRVGTDNYTEYFTEFTVFVNQKTAVPSLTLDTTYAIIATGTVCLFALLLMCLYVALMGTHRAKYRQSVNVSGQEKEKNKDSFLESEDFFDFTGTAQQFSESFLAFAGSFHRFDNLSEPEPVDAQPALETARNDLHNSQLSRVQPHPTLTPVQQPRTPHTQEVEYTTDEQAKTETFSFQAKYDNNCSDYHQMNEEENHYQNFKQTAV